jgi:hypothetical protein
MDQTRTFVDKLGLREGQSVCLLDAPPDFVEARLEGALNGCRVGQTLDNDGQADMIIAWPQEKNGLDDLFRRLRAAVVPDGAVWIVIPKKEAARRRGFGPDFEEVQRAALPTGLVDNKVLSFSDEEYGIRFVVRRTERGQRP